MKHSLNIAFLSFAIFSLFLISCEKEKAATTKLSLAITDSIRIDYLGLLDFMDIQPKSERILFHDRQRGIILMTDFKGNLLLRMEKGGDQKDSYGGFLYSAAKIKDREDISLVSQNGFFEYDANGNLISHRAFSKDPPLLAGRAAADTELMEHKGLFYQKGLVAWGKYNKTEDEYYNQFQLLVKFDPEKGTAERIINLEEDSPFRSTGRAYEISEMNPSLTILGDQLLVIAGTDPYLNFYDIDSSHQLLNRKRIAYPNYHMGEGADRSKADPKAIAFDESAGRTYTLKVYKDYLITSFSTGYEPADREAYKAIKNREDYSDFKNKIKNKYQPALFLMNHQGEALQSLALPDKLDHRQFLVRNGSLWWLSKFNTDKEEDFVKIYKVEIIEK
ncbi:hypothetical protein GCM10027284_05230 [Cyclobacterium sediminis]